MNGWGIRRQAIILVVCGACGGRSSLDISHREFDATTGGNRNTSGVSFGGTTVHASNTESGGAGQSTSGLGTRTTGSWIGTGGSRAMGGGAPSVGGTSTGGFSNSDTNTGPLSRTGLIAWTHTGRPSLNRANNLYTTGGGYMGSAKSLWMLDKASGVDLWSLVFSGNVCETKSAFVTLAGNTLSGFTPSDGTLRWSVQSDSIRDQSCTDQSELFFTTEESSGWALNAYASTDGSRVWRRALAAKAVVERVTAETVYVSESIEGQSTLQALNAHDGTTLWSSDFVASRPIEFLFDAEERVFALDTSDGQPSLTRVNTADGTLSWVYRTQTPSLEPILENSPDYLLVRAANQLTALDKATGAELWNRDLAPDAADVTWHAHFTGVGDVLLIRYDAAEVSTASIRDDGVARWTLPTSVEETETGDLYLLDTMSLSRLDRYTGKAVWNYAPLPANGTYELLGSHRDQVFLAGPCTGGWSPAPMCTLTSLNGSDGHVSWQSAEQIAGSLVAADDERIYLWSGANSKYDTYGITTALWFTASAALP